AHALAAVEHRVAHCGVQPARFALLGQQMRLDELLEASLAGRDPIGQRGGVRNGGSPLGNGCHAHVAVSADSAGVKLLSTSSSSFWICCSASASRLWQKRASSAPRRYAAIDSS